MSKNMIDIEEFTYNLKGYVDRMIKIRSLSSPEVLGISNAEAYSAVLLENFKNIGVMAEKNRELISDIINPILSSVDPLDPKVIKAVEKLNEELLDASEVEMIDLPLATLLTDRLLQDADMKEDIDYRIKMLDKEIENSYLMIMMTKKVISDPRIVEHYRKKGIEALRQLLVFLDKERFLELSEESRETIVANARYGVALYECWDLEDGEWTTEQFRLLENALAIADDPFYLEALPEYDWKYHLFRVYDFLTRLDYTFSEPEIVQKAVQYSDICSQLWKSDPEYYKQLNEFDEIEGRRLRILFLAGSITEHEYREKLYAMYQRRGDYEYNALGYDMNIEYPMEYILSMDENDISEKDMRRADEIYRSALAYIFHMPKLGLLSATLDPYSKLLVTFEEFPGNIGFEEMGIRSFAALHPPTYIHSKMVAGITGCLTRHLIRMRPELFDNVLSYLGYKDLHKDMNEIIEYAYHAALCHDFGKLMIIDTIFVYGRKLLDMEFDLVKQHPDIGYHLLMKHQSTQRYAEVARGHHLWYDGSKGYPMGFNGGKSPVKIITDIVTIADCMDAATDSVGRSYNRGKTFKDYEQEVIRDAGTRYAPWGPELLRDEKTKRDLDHLLDEGRMNLYRETYRLLASL